MSLVDLNYNFECDLLIELSDNKRSHNNLASESEKNTEEFFKLITIEEVVIFLANRVINK